MTESKETLTLLIKGIEEKKAANGSTFEKVETDKGWYALFEPSEMRKLIIGEMAECEIETKGKYRNIVKVLSSKPPEKPAEKGADKPWTNRHSADERASIEAQVAFKGAVELLVNKVITGSETFLLTAVVCHWIYERLYPELGDLADNQIQQKIRTGIVDSPPPLPPKATAPVLKEAAEKTGAVAIDEEILPKMSTSGEFAQAIKKFGLGITDLSPEIKEMVTRKDYEAAYKAIKGKCGQ